ncbi:MAG: nitroreductase family protein [Allobaculum sp.]|uniref:nitroreductase family protein n=1 Tax=Allobaculum sp. TaxID=1872463 RepID=UPI00399AEF1D
MNLVLDLFRTRRSYRKYSEKPIDEAVLKQIMEVGLISPTGDNFKTVELILIKDKDLLNEIASMRKAAAMLRHAGAAIIVLVNTQKTDLWIEDGAISASYMYLAADALGIGSCWIQVRARDAVDGKEFEENFKRNSIYQSI